MPENDADPWAVEGSSSERGASPEYAETLFSLSRRHDLAFSVVVVRLREHDDAPDAETRCNTVSGHEHVARLWQLVEAETRETDLLADWSHSGAAVVACPATPPEGAKKLANRLRTRAGKLRVGVGCASFRQDALTLPDLVECARQREVESQPGRTGDSEPPSGSGLRLRARSQRASLRRGAGAQIKRLFDLAVIVVAAPIWLPLVALIAVAVKLSDPSAPIFFSQARTGRGGQRFPMYKFRTMVPEAEQLKHELLRHSERAWPDFKIEHDPRITRIGKWLRASSLDELPQLWNVLRGEMSLVGPRPTSFSAETYESWQTARLQALPGLTGLWQVEARDSADFSERIRLDLRYVRKQGFLSDLKILLRTVPAVLHRKGH